jgi:hypothetical protein
MAVHYRIVKYEGDDSWMKEQLDRSMPTGIKVLPKGTITVADVDPDNFRSIKFVRDRLWRMLAKVEE